MVDELLGHGPVLRQLSAVHGGLTDEPYQLDVHELVVLLLELAVRGLQGAVSAAPCVVGPRPQRKHLALRLERVPRPGGGGGGGGGGGSSGSHRGPGVLFPDCGVRGGCIGATAAAATAAAAGSRYTLESQSEMPPLGTRLDGAWCSAHRTLQATRDKLQQKCNKLKDTKLTRPIGEASVYRAELAEHVAVAEELISHLRDEAVRRMEAAAGLDKPSIVDPEA